MFSPTINKFFKFTMLFLVGFCFVVLIANETNAQQIEESKCDFSRFKPLLIGHPQADYIVKKVSPEYPPSAKAVRAEGEVKLYVIVDRNGDAVEACVFKGHPLLRAAARTAALQWKFKKNLGLSRKSKQRYKRGYRQEVVVFNFNM